MSEETTIGTLGIPRMYTNEMTANRRTDTASTMTVVVLRLSVVASSEGLVARTKVPTLIHRSPCYTIMAHDLGQGPKPQYTPLIKHDQ